MARLLGCYGIALACLSVSAAVLPAQQVTLGTPLIGFHDSFNESLNVGWGFRWFGPRGGMFFDFGGPGNAIPPFGGFSSHPGAQFGIAQRWGNADFHFGFSAAAGRSTTMPMSSASLTVMNGAPGFIQDVTMRPFVIGLIPVIGGYPTYPIVAYPYAFYPYPVNPYSLGPSPWGAASVTPVRRLTSPLTEKLAP